MKRKIFLTLILTAFLVISVSSQGISERQATEKDSSAELKSNAVKMLKETASEIEGLRTVENKISFSTEMANLMWFHDEREARKMFENVIGNFTNLLSQYNAEISQIKTSGETMEIYEVRNLPAQGGIKNPYLKLFEALSIRKQIALSIAEHDAELAFAFVNDTSKLITDKDFKSGAWGSDSDLEGEIINVMRVKNTDSALRIGKEKLKDGLSYSLLNLAKKIYAEDAEKGRDFAADIISKIKTDKSKTDSYVLINVLNFGKEDIKEVRKNPSKKSLFSESDLRDIAEILAQNLLAEGELSEDTIETYVEILKPFSPSGAAQIKAKYQASKNKTEISGAKIGTQRVRGSFTIEETDQENLTPQQKAAAEKRKSQENLLKELGTLDTKKLSVEERKKFTEKGRQIIATMTDPTQKIIALSLLAVLVKQLGDKQLASEMMSQANSLINPQPVNYMDYMHTWMLVGGFSEIDAEKAFPMLENMIYRLNDTISAFVKVGEFIDVSGSMIQNGEVQLGMFGGRLAKDFMKTLNNSDKVLLNLAQVDFNRAADLANKFERPEVQIMAKMLILRSILENKVEQKKQSDVPKGVLTSSPPEPVSEP
jgi:hypothetical protein